MKPVQFSNQAAQGDMIIRRVEKLPDGLVLDKSDNGRLILAHSETGHSHVIREQDGVKLYANQNNPLVAYLVVDNTCLLEHERGFDTHAPVKIDKGIYEVRRQREYTPEGWRRAID